MLREEYLVCMNLHKKLKEKIKGSIFIKIENNVLSIYIDTKKKVKFKKDIYDVSSKRDIEKIAEMIEGEYRRFINNKFFHKNNRRFRYE